MIPYKGIKTSDELAYLMYKNMASEVAEQNIGSEKISEAIDCMSKAAEILESLNDHQASEAITVILEKMAGINV